MKCEPERSISPDTFGKGRGIHSRLASFLNHNEELNHETTGCASRKVAKTPGT